MEIAQTIDKAINDYYEEQVNLSPDGNRKEIQIGGRNILSE